MEVVVEQLSSQKTHTCMSLLDAPNHDWFTPQKDQHEIHYKRNMMYSGVLVVEVKRVVHSFYKISQILELQGVTFLAEEEWVTGSQRVTVSHIPHRDRVRTEK